MAPSLNWLTAYHPQYPTPSINFLFFLTGGKAPPSVSKPSSDNGQAVFGT